MRALLLFIVFGCVHSMAQGAPDPPFEELLRRAETVLMARITSVNADGVTLQRTQLLRGTSDLEFTMHIDRDDRPNFSLQPGVDCFLLSQGDKKHGPPRPLLGCSFDDKANYRGWMTLPVKRVGKEVYVGGVLSYTDCRQNPVVKFDVRGESIALSLTCIQSLIERFPYGSMRAGR